MNNISKRESGMDILRILACLFVVSAHFHLNVGYYQEPLVGNKMAILTGSRWLFVTTIPIFFMITGYFKINKTFSKSHYKSIIPLLISYLVISICKMLLYNRLFGKIYYAKDMAKNLGNYQIAWFLGMYLCLFLLIPFLNKLWHNLTDKEEIALIAILLFLCGIYPLFNYIAPSYFISLYPVMYYFIGAYIKKHRPKFNKLILLAITIIICLLETVISIKFSSTGVFDWNLLTTPDGGYGSILLAICAVCLFLIFYDIQINNGFINKILSAISNVSFEIYLFAGAYDAIIYQYFKRTYTGPNEFFWLFFITVPLSFICAVISSIVFRKIVDGILKGIESIFKKNNTI